MRRRNHARAIALPIRRRHAPSIPVLAASALILGGLLLSAEAHAQSAQNGATAGPGMNAETGTARMNEQDRLFLKTAGPANLAETETGRLAVKKATTPTIREFGRWMTSAHGTADSELRILTQAMHITAPRNSLNTMQKAEYGKLESLSGSRFDEQYLRMQVQAHHQAIALFQQEASKGENKWLTTFATTLEPELHHHLAEAEDLLKAQSNLGN